MNTTPLRTRAAAVALAAAATLGAAGCSNGDPTGPSTTDTSGSSGAPGSPTSSGSFDPSQFSASGPLGLKRSTAAPTPYLSGVWIGGKPYVNDWLGFGTWRGATVEVVLGYDDPASWESMSASGNVPLFDKFPGTLVYGLAMVPKGQTKALREVADGAHDDVWRAAAKELVDHHRQRSVIRIGLEANGTWFPWGATAQTAEDWKAAFRHIVDVLREGGAEPVVDFDIGCGVGLTGDSDPMAPLTKLYPGDDIVDIVGCDVYDDKHGGGNPLDQSATGKGPTVQQALDFAKSHGKKFAVPEWGLNRQHGEGDNPDFIARMYDFFDQHGDDIAFEIFFNEGGTDIKSSLWNPVQNPRAAEKYAQIWHGRQGSKQ